MPSSPMESWRKHKVDYLPQSMHQEVIVSGRTVPGVSVVHGTNGRLHISVGIHGFDCDVFDGEAILGLVADAVAIGAGYVGWPDEGLDFVPRPFAPVVHVITTTTTDDPSSSDGGSDA